MPGFFRAEPVSGRSISWTLWLLFLTPWPIAKLFMGAPDAVSNAYGTEIDLIGTYKISNNLSYMLGFGYLFTGDYFKGFDPTTEVSDNYMLINKLTLTF